MLSFLLQKLDPLLELSLLISDILYTAVDISVHNEERSNLKIIAVLFPLATRSSTLKFQSSAR